MAESFKSNFPVIPVKNWWAIRERFKKSIPSEVTPSYIASVLQMAEKSAKTNILPSLKYMGIIDEDGKPKDRAVKWRDDKHYSEVCESIRNEVYPQELLEVASDAESDQERARHWVANNTGLGESAVRRILAVYQLLLEADPDKSTGAIQTRSSQSRKKQSQSKSGEENAKSLTSSTDKTEVESSKTKSDTPETRRERRSETELHLNIQIHISPESTPDQIDQIFASMAKYLKET